MGNANSILGFPETCKAECVFKKVGPDSRVEVEDMPVSEPGKPFRT